jgi:tRNA-specific 2-thiouridylase
VCDLLGIAHYALNFREAFEKEVVADFAREYASGRTPNPCIVCNDRLKFSDLLARVSSQGADYLATGHYARIVRDDSGTPWLARGVDSAKDQSYFLYRLTPTQLDHVLFPVGELEKPAVRAIAHRMGLHVAEKPDSQEVCFASAGAHAAVVGVRHPEAQVSGDIVDTDGAVIGRHSGIAEYTVGQRKGLGIAGPSPLYVLAIDAPGNRVVVGTRDRLAARVIEASDAIWRGGSDEHVCAMVRYRMEPAEACATAHDGRMEVRFEETLFGVAPGQAVVCYRDELVVGGGTIECAS